MACIDDVSGPSDVFKVGVKNTFVHIEFTDTYNAENEQPVHAKRATTDVTHDRGTRAKSDGSHDQGQVASSAIVENNEVRSGSEDEIDVEPPDRVLSSGETPDRETSKDIQNFMASKLREHCAEKATESKGMEPEMSVGSYGHAMGDCNPCAWFWKGGCQNGKNCTFCHLCDKGEVRRCKREKRAAARQHEKQQTLPDSSHRTEAGAEAVACKAPPKSHNLDAYNLDDSMPTELDMPPPISMPYCAPSLRPSSFEVLPAVVPIVLRQPQPHTNNFLAQVSQPQFSRIDHVTQGDASNFSNEFSSTAQCVFQQTVELERRANAAEQRVAAAEARAAEAERRLAERERHCVLACEVECTSSNQQTMMPQWTEAMGSMVEAAASVGSVGHSKGSCRPCVWYWKPGVSCSKGSTCEYCHLCDEGAVSRAVEGKKINWRKSKKRSDF